MMSRFVTVLLFLAGVLVFGSNSAHAQKLVKGGLSGTVVSFRAQPAANGSVLMTTAPAADSGKFLVITEMCVNGNSVGVNGSTYGGLFSSGPGCMVYTPGVAIPSGDLVSCTEGGGSPGTVCQISGVITK